MATYIEMPKLADTMTEGTLVRWKKKEGDRVEAGDVLAEVETDKATMEMEAFDDGILHQQLVKEGQKVPIGTRIALLLEKGEQAPQGEAPAAAKSEKPPVAIKAPASEDQAHPAGAPSGGKGGNAGETAQARSDSKGGAISAAAPSRESSGGRVKSSPLARKIAQAEGVDLTSLQGTGPGGRIVARDVQAAPRGHGAGQPVAPAAAPAVPSTLPGEGDQRIALSGMRRIIAERLLASKTQLPHFYLHIEVDAGPLMQLRAQANAASDAGSEVDKAPKLTVNDFILKAVVTAAAKVPAVNASFAGDSIIQYAAINLAVAIAVEEGLVTPVIREAQKRSLRDISAAVKDLAARARNKKLKPEEYQGGTITVSNLGAYGIEFFDAIINPPQALIVSVGAVIKKPVVGPGDQIVVGQRMGIGLSADHRVVDGAVGAQFLAELRRLLESPALMLM